MMPKNKVKKTTKKGYFQGGSHKPREFEIYVLWKSLPPLFGRQIRDNKTGQLVDVVDALSINDEEIRKLVLIKNQTEFSKKYKTGQKTLSDWNKRIENEDLLFRERKKWVKKLMSNVLGAVYRKALIEGDSNRAKFLAQYAEEFEEKTQIRDPELSKQTELLQNLLNRKF